MILGITGTNGAGKGSVVDYLVREKAFTHYSFRDLITEEVIRRGLEVIRPNMGAVGTDLRTLHGPAYFTDTFIARAEAEGRQNIIMESVRALAEAENIRAHGGFTVGVDAPEELRYARITERKSATDRVSFEEFRAQEDAEYYTKDPNDPAQMNVLGVLAAADYTLVNDGTLTELHAKIEAMLEELSHINP
jgi:dephospho-CoA kinase